MDTKTTPPSGTMLPRVRLKGTAVCGTALAVIGALPVVPAPIPALALDRPLGTVLYLVALGAAAIGYLIFHVREHAAETRAQKARDIRDAEVAQDLRQIKADMAALKTSKAPTDSPEVKQLVERVESSADRIGRILSIELKGTVRPEGTLTAKVIKA